MSLGEYSHLTFFFPRYSIFTMRAGSTGFLTNISEFTAGLRPKGHGREVAVSAEITRRDEELFRAWHG
ncbi:MAG: hypothetical protein LBG26_04555, partial [Treponema sp.]|nr:hypothetical protein [Treponema sp.]